VEGIQRKLYRVVGRTCYDIIVGRVGKGRE
jgi:hypothetical protein